MSLHLFRCIKLNFEQVIIAGSNPEGICELIKPCQQKYLNWPNDIKKLMIRLCKDSKLLRWPGQTIMRLNDELILLDLNLQVYKCL